MNQIHFWDMDHTILNNDCDVSWKAFLVAHGYAPESDIDEADAFFEQYKRGELRVDAFIAFQLRDFRGKLPHEVAPWVQQHFAEIAKPALYTEAKQRIDAQLAAGLQVCLLTATNREIAAPVAAALGLDLLATELAVDATGRFTGKIAGQYCCGAGKLSHIDQYCAAHGSNRAHAWYYGDSTADIPILQEIGHPVAVNPSPELHREATAQGWPIWQFS